MVVVGGNIILPHFRMIKLCLPSRLKDYTTQGWKGQGSSSQNFQLYILHKPAVPGTQEAAVGRSPHPEYTDSRTAGSQRENLNPALKTGAELMLDKVLRAFNPNVQEVKVGGFL